MSKRTIADPADFDDVGADEPASGDAPVSSHQLPAFLAESRSLERDYIGEIMGSRRTAWRMAGVMTLVAFAGLAAGVAALFQPPASPLVLRVDQASGAVEQVTALRIEESYGEVVDNYWLNRYVLDRESYDYNTIQSTYGATALMSAAEVQQDYHKLYDGAEARDRVLANKARITVTIRSIQPTSKGQAVVRFATEKVDTANGTKEPLRHWIATIAYAYMAAPMRAEDRRINPLGFQVTSYRVDPESAAGTESGS